MSIGVLALAAGAVLASAALVAAVLAWRVEDVATTAARTLFRLGVGALWIAVGVVVVALIREDTSLVIVVDHTRPGLGVARRVMGLWGGSEGSLLFFTAVIGTVLAVAPTNRRALPLGPLVVSVLAWASVAATSPFERLDAPAIAGSGLSPILEHWAMLIHPPLLYLGMALALVPAVAYPTSVRRWTAAAIAVLTAALALGSGWAYVELGWGGWWAWDPVENAALIPWLLLVTNFHVRPDHVIGRAAALLVWPAVIGGAAMTRTSLRTSVHAFADAEVLRWYLWPLTAAVGLIALALYAADGDHRQAAARTRVLAAVLLMFGAVVIAFGTFRPFVPGDATDGSFYTRSLYSVAVLGPVAMGLAPRLRSADHRRLRRQVALGAAAGAALGVIAGWTAWYQLGLAAGLGAGVLTTLADERRQVARTSAHLGLMFVLVGALAGTASTTRTLGVERGGSFEVAGHTITNDGSGLRDGLPIVLFAEVRVDDTPLTPEVTVHPERGLRLPEVAMRSRPWEDVQVLLRSADDDGSALLTVNVQPFTQFVWYGAALIVLGAARHGVRPRAGRVSPVEPVAAH